MRKTFILTAMLVLVVAVFGQKADSPAIKWPAQRAADMRAIKARKAELQAEWGRLDMQEVIVAQRAALELKIPAEQLDKMIYEPDADGYVFKERPQATPTPK